MDNGYIGVDEFCAKRIKRRTWILFSCILLVDVAAVVLFVLFPDYWGVELLGGILFTVLDVLYILLNGLFLATRYAFKMTDSSIHVRRVIATDKYAVYRKDGVGRIKVRRRKVGGEEYYHLRFRTEGGAFSLKYLTRECAEEVLSQFRGAYDERVFAEQA